MTAAATHFAHSPRQDALTSACPFGWHAGRKKQRGLKERQGGAQGATPADVEANEEEIKRAALEEKPKEAARVMPSHIGKKKGRK